MLVKLATDINESIIAGIVSSAFSINKANLSLEKDVVMECHSKYRFDYIASSGDSKYALLVPLKPISVRDIIKFNSAATDCRIFNKLFIRNVELNDHQIKLLTGFNIKVLELSPYSESSHISKRSMFGLSVLDSKLSGGLRSGYVYMISGKPGAGKTTLASTFLAHGAASGEKGVMVLTDTLPDQFMDNIRTMDMGFKEQFDRKMIEVLEISDQIRSMKVDVSSGNMDFRKFITKMVNELKSFIIDHDIKRVVIDQITPLLIPNDDFINIFINSLSMPDVTMIIVSGLRNSDMSVFGIEEYYVTGVIKLDYSYQNNSLNRTGQILKMRGTAFDSSPFHFDITSTGIKINDSNRDINITKIDEQGTSDTQNIFKSIR